MAQATATVLFKGNEKTLSGSPPTVGQPAPDFTAVAKDLSEVRLSDFKGKAVVVSVVPSLDTPVCDVQTRRFNQEAGSFGDNVVVLTISMDLPFAQKRWCGAAGVEQVITISDYKDRSFGEAFGLRIQELGLLARAVFVIDKDGVVRYAEVVSEVTQEPDYEGPLAALKSLV